MGRLASSGWGGALLSLAAVIVLTMLVQAFVFESIRVLEGFWGTSWLGRLVADRRADHHASVRRILQRDYIKATEDGWALVRSALEREWDKHLKEVRADAKTRADETSSIWKTCMWRKGSRSNKSDANAVDPMQLNGAVLRPEMLEVLEASIVGRRDRCTLQRAQSRCAHLRLGSSTCSRNAASPCQFGEATQRLP